MGNYISEIKYFLSNKAYLFSTSILAMLSYGYAAVNTSIGIDDIRGNLEIGAGRQVIASGRFSQAIWPYLLGYKTAWIENSFTIDLLAVLVLLFAALNCCILFRRIAKDEIPDIAYAIFSCLMITYPLTHEIWEYTHINLCISIGILFGVIALQIAHKMVNCKFKIIDFIIASLLLMIVCAGYESPICVYIFLVFAILFLSTIFEQQYSVKLLLKQGCIYACCVIAGIILRVTVHSIILNLFHIPPDVNGATAIIWKQYNFISTLYSLFVSWIDSYLLKGIIYFPLTEMLVALVIYFSLICYFGIKMKKINIWITGFGMLFSLVALSLLQGNITYYRSCQVFSFFIAFTGMILYYLIYQKKKQVILHFATGMLLLICLIQSINLNYWLTLNHFRSNEEISIIKKVGIDLTSEYDLNKPVVILGGYQLSNYIIESKSISQDDIRWKIYCHIYAFLHKEDYITVYNNNSRILCQTDANCVINWAIGDQTDIFNLFRLQGIDYIFPNEKDLRSKAEEYIYTHYMPEFPRHGYIADAGEFIVVYLH